MNSNVAQRMEPCRMNLYHYSPKRFPKIDTTIWAKQKISDKPRGLWLSDDDGDKAHSWRQWAISEQFRLDHLRFRYLVRLKEDHNVLLLRNYDEIMRFGRTYWKPFPHEQKPYIGSSWNVDWPTVAEKYQGIIITPYNWKAKLSSATSWYYGWDCASACIWDIEALSDFTFDQEMSCESCNTIYGTKGFFKDYDWPKLNLCSSCGTIKTQLTAQEAKSHA